MADQQPKSWAERAKELKLNARETAFCQALVERGVEKRNGSEAARVAGYAAGSAHVTASRLLARDKIQTFIKELQDAAIDESILSAREVLHRYSQIATADARELIENHRRCCRYCWGEHNRYQWTPAEFEEADRLFQAQQRRFDAGKIDEEPTQPDPAGGIDYDARRRPNAECPECFGRGEIDVQMNDTRDLSPEAATLFAGIKVTKDGFEIKTLDQQAALRGLAEHHNLFEKHQKAGSGEITVVLSEKDEQL